MPISVTVGGGNIAWADAVAVSGLGDLLDSDIFELFSCCGFARICLRNVTLIVVGGGLQDDLPSHDFGVAN